MRVKVILLLLLLPLGIFSQTKKVTNLPNVETEWLTIATDWNYQKGDNLEWAQPYFDDSSWGKLSSTNLNMLDSVAIAGSNEIVWFRQYIQIDRPINDALVLRISQTGASEIYLDGLLLHTLGTVSSNPNDVEKYNPYNTLLSLPLVKNKEHLLAVRFVNYQPTYPLFKESTSWIELSATSLTNLLTNGPELSFVVDNDLQINMNTNYIALGIGLFMFILFLSYYVFFPSEKINAYFALTSLFFSLFMVTVIIAYQIGRIFAIDLSITITAVVYSILILFCFYKILDQKLGAFFWCLVTIHVLRIPMAFLFDASLTDVIVGMITMFEIIRISIKSYKTHKTAARLFIAIQTITILFWMIVVANRLFKIEILDLENYQAVAFSLGPIAIAIYLGLAFAQRSKALRAKLEEVEVLSKEKEQILSKQNETLEQQVTERTASLNQSLENLKAAQAQLVQSEKMASLGELTAGIAHEIQNPLNFVNNFAEVNSELIEEMKEELDKGNVEEVKSLADDIDANEKKIMFHGKRADSIVKGMLQHSRNSNGKKESTNINALADEYLRLAYHGLRAKDKSFNATMVTDFDDSIGTVNIISQDIGRVILNLITNAFYVVDEKKKSGVENYEPTVTVKTKKENATIEIHVSDNGNGIPENIVNRIFEPFFTTKPTGQGTGLGLSMSYDIIKAHGGELTVETKEHLGTEFKIEIPII